MVSAITLVADGLLLTGLLLGVAGTLDLRRFLARTPELGSVEDLQVFRRIVARQMYASLVVLTLAVATVAVVAYGFFQDLIGWSELRYVLGLGSLFVVVGAWCSAVEAKVKEIPAADDKLRAERDRLVATWRSKAFPDW